MTPPQADTERDIAGETLNAIGDLRTYNGNDEAYHTAVRGVRKLLAEIERLRARPSEGDKLKADGLVYALENFDPPMPNAAAFVRRLAGLPSVAEEAEPEKVTPWNCPDCGGLGASMGCRTCNPTVAAPEAPGETEDESEPLLWQRLLKRSRYALRAGDEELASLLWRAASIIEGALRSGSEPAEYEQVVNVETLERSLRVATRTFQSSVDEIIAGLVDGSEPAPDHSAMLNDVDVGEPVSLSEAAAMGRRLAEPARVEEDETAARVERIADFFEKYGKGGLSVDLRLAAARLRTAPSPSEEVVEEVVEAERVLEQLADVNDAGELCWCDLNEGPVRVHARECQDAKRFMEGRTLTGEPGE